MPANRLLGGYSSVVKDQEIWALADGFPDYDVSTHGRIRRNRSTFGTQAGRIVQGSIDRHGYRRVCIQRDKRSHSPTVHSLVCKTFIGPRPDGFQVAHNDGDKVNNHISNLRWASCADNMQDKEKHGTVAKGERNGGGGKLTEDRAKEIKYGSEGPAKTARSFQVSESLVWAIRSGRCWAHV